MSMAMLFPDKLLPPSQHHQQQQQFSQFKDLTALPQVKIFIYFVYKNIIFQIVLLHVPL